MELGESKDWPRETWEEHLTRIRVFDRDRVAARFCGFVDILGFSAAILRDLPTMLQLYERLLERSEFLASLHPDVRISVHSDSFVIVSDNLPRVIVAIQNLQWLILMEDYLVRGGIAYGEHAEGEKAGVRFVI